MIEKIFLLVVGFVSLFFGTAPIVLHGTIHTGVVALIILGCIFLFLSASISNPKRFVLCRVLLLLIAPAFVIAGVLSIFMLQQAKPQEYPPDSVLVVLGGAIRNGAPGAVLQSRLDTALAYLEEHPDTKIVVTGGNEAAGREAEAVIMRNYLLTKGVSYDQIILEKNASNTKENMQFTAAELNFNGIWTKNIITVTNDFHQLRTHIYGGRIGLATYPLNSSTPWVLAPSSWMREYFALLGAFIR